MRAPQTPRRNATTYASNAVLTTNVDAIVTSHLDNVTAPGIFADVCEPGPTTTIARMKVIRILLIAALLGGCATSETGDIDTTGAMPEAVSLLGDSLVPTPLPDSVRRQYEMRLQEAQEELARDPTSADAAIWVGRRLGYLGRYREAIDTFSRAIDLHPEDARLYRHRGHRYITVRLFDSAVTDLERAAALVAGQPDEIEPDGIPNARNIPTSTLQSNIWYHLGLAYYLQGDFERARDAYREALRVSTNPDMLVATTHWAYMTHRRLGKEAEAARLLAPISRDMDIIENDAYHRLLLMYKGELAVDSLLPAVGDTVDAVQDATVAYGVGSWHLYNGRADQAVSVFSNVMRNTQWAAFGYIASEAELARTRH